MNLTTDFSLLTVNNASLSDTFRIALYEKNESLFELLSYEDDITFLEPSLICHFLSDLDESCKIPLYQTILGYIPQENLPKAVVLKADRFGMVNIPNIGYLKAIPNSLTEYNLSQIDSNIIPNRFVKNSRIRLCLHPTDPLGYAEGIIFHESIEQTLLKNIKSLERAVLFFQNYLQELWKAIDYVTREFVVFSSPNHNSFAGINHHGTAYFNTENRLVSPIFFIDDIAHQCGHVIFNVLTLKTSDFLRVPQKTLLRDFTNDINENRDVYGAFHGLYTYSITVISLRRVIEKKELFTEEHITEAKARLGFYMQKFDIDLKNMGNRDILTDLGLEYYNIFYKTYEFVRENYRYQFIHFTYNNQPYIFDFEAFKKENHI